MPHIYDTTAVGQLPARRRNQRDHLHHAHIHSNSLFLSSSNPEGCGPDQPCTLDNNKSKSPLQVHSPTTIPSP